MRRLIQLMLLLGSILGLNLATSPDCLAQSRPINRSVLKPDLRGKPEHVVHSRVDAKKILSDAAKKVKVPSIKQSQHYSKPIKATKIKTHFPAVKPYTVRAIPTSKRSPSIVTPTFPKTKKLSNTARIRVRPAFVESYVPGTGSADDPIVYITHSSKKYHREGCRYAANGQIPIRRSVARSKGLTACSVCSRTSRPPVSAHVPEVPEVPEQRERIDPPPVPESQLETGRTVYITRSGHKYHNVSCRHLGQNAIPISLKDATSKGYTPCSVCGG